MTLQTQLIACGCSFTEQAGWANQVKTALDYRKLRNLAIGGGTNRTQVNRFNDFLLSNHEPFDLIWQITFPDRVSNIRLPPDHPDVVTKKFLPRSDRGFTYAQRSPCANYIDGRKHVDVLYDEYVSRVQDPFYADVNNDLSQMLCAILLAKKLARNVMVFFAIDTVDAQQIIAMETFFQKYHIPFVPYDKNLLAFVKKNHLAMAQDGFHPAHESYTSYADKVLLPALQAQWKI